MKKTSIFILVVLALLIGLVAGFYAAGMSKTNSFSAGGSGAGMKKGDYKDTFSEGWRAAKEKLNESGMFAMPMMDEGKMISGQVKEISGNKLVIETSLRNPLDDESLKVRTVSVDKAALVVRKRLSQEEIEKNRVQGQKELEEVNTQITFLDKNMVDCQPPVMAGEDPCADRRAERDRLFSQSMEINQKMMGEYYEIKNPSLEDIAVGYYVNVRADENISEKTEFSVLNVDAMENMAAPVMPSAPEAPLAE